MPVWDLEARVQDEADVYVVGPAGGRGAGASKDQQPPRASCSWEFPLPQTSTLRAGTVSVYILHCQRRIYPVDSRVIW